MSAPWLQIRTDGSFEIKIYAQPGARKTQIVGEFNQQIKIRVQAPPVDGKANDELRRFLADTLKCPLKEVQLLRGEKSRNKVFSINSGSAVAVQKAIQLVSDNLK